MIVQATSDTKQISLRLRINKGQSCCTSVQLHITPIVCEQPEQRCYVWKGCGGGFESVKIHSEQPLTLVYDMFDKDENGNAQFLLDNQFADLPCGRYNAEIVACGCTTFKFQIDKRDTLNVSGITVNNQADCCEGKNGC